MSRNKIIMRKMQSSARDCPQPCLRLDCRSSDTQQRTPPSGRRVAGTDICPTEKTRSRFGHATTMTLKCHINVSMFIAMLEHYYSDQFRM